MNQDSIPESTPMESDFKRRENDELKERVKELNCLYGISDIVKDNEISIEQALQKIVELLPPAWKYDEVAYARITINGNEFTSGNYRETPWTLVSGISVSDKKIGSVEVGYLEERPEEDDGPFLKDEKRLLNAITELLSTFVEEKRVREELKKHRADINNGRLVSITRDGPSGKQDWEVIIDLLMKTDPRTLLRITRKMVYHLYRTQNKEINELLNTVCPIDGGPGDSQWCGINMPNPRQDLDSLKIVQEKVFETARECISSQDISELFHRWLREDKARPLLLASQRIGIPLVEITDELNRFFETTGSEGVLAPEDHLSICTALTKRFFTDRLEFLNISKKYITVDDFVPLLKHIIGPAQGAGKLGGKASGIFLANKILESEMDKDEIFDFVSFQKSWHITSDTMMDLIQYNDLDEVIHLKYLDPSEIRQEQPFLEQIFKNAVFTAEMVDGLKRILSDLEDKPIIVRSSSLLEDSFGAAFSGKYKSLFLANIGTEEERLNDLMNAIAEVYASTMGSDPIEYRRERGLLDVNEEMGILIQEVVGEKVGPYFFPAYAGVAFSRNEFRWSPRIRREDGIIRLVTGLGTRAVDRIGNDYPMLVSPNRPELRVNTLVEERVKYSQRYMDVINLEKGIIETVEVQKLITEYEEDFPKLKKIISVYEDEQLKPYSVLRDLKRSDSVITFSGLLKDKKFMESMRRLLNLLEQKMGIPVDVEFASDGEKLYILQCRPQSQSREIERKPIPRGVKNNRKIFSANRYVTTGHVDNIQYVVYVVPEAYMGLESKEEMKNVARTVSELNSVLPRRKFILMGPGRWGSRGDIKLGVPVVYRDINNTTLLVEVAREKGDYLPELSFGTHFFQDLVEADINYLPLYPDEEENIYNEELLMRSKNRLGELLPRWEHMGEVVRVIKVSDLLKDGMLEVVMDGEANEALAYLKPRDHWAWRMEKAKELAKDLDADFYGVEAIYVCGSTKDATAGPRSDIDLIIHFKGSDDRKEKLLNWLKKKNRQLVEENEERTGYRVDSILDAHLVTDDDIEKRTSWACHIDSTYNSARKIPLD
ncbi:MAG: PEP/pyruvate-binding domain-containing protein [Thermoplasmata archaeon]